MATILGPGGTDYSAMGGLGGTTSEGGPSTV